MRLATGQGHGWQFTVDYGPNFKRDYASGRGHYRPALAQLYEPESILGQSEAQAMRDGLVEAPRRRWKQNWEEIALPVFT